MPSSEPSRVIRKSGPLGRLAVASLIFALGAGFDWPSHTDRLLRELTAAQDLPTRCDLLRMLGRVADPRALEALLTATRDPAAEIRIEALGALTRKPPEPTRSALLHALADPQPGVRVQAASVLGRKREKAALPNLTRALADGDTTVRMAVTVALGRLGDAGAIVPLATALDDPSLEVRLQAVLALAELGDPNAFSLVLGKLMDPVPELRAAVADALPRLDPTRAEPALIQALEDSSEAVVLTALRGLVALHTTLSPELSAQLELLAKNSHARVAIAARATRAALAEPPPVDHAEEPGWIALLERTAEPDANQDGTLLAALEAELPEGESLTADPLSAWLPRAAAKDRARIARLIARAGPHAAGSLPQFLSDSDPAVRTAVARALGRASTGVPIASLEAALSDASSEVRSEAALALARHVDVETLCRLARRLPQASAEERLPLASTTALGLERLGSELSNQQRVELSELFQRALRDSDQALAALAARALGFVRAASSFAALREAATAAPSGVRVAALRASVSFHGQDARNLRSSATQASDARVSVTAMTAQWLAGDPIATPVASVLETMRWPEGPVTTFIRASNPEPNSPHVCRVPEIADPASLVNSILLIPSQGDARCLAEAARAWFQPLRPWPLRYVLARWLRAEIARDGLADPQPWQAALKRCEVDDPSPFVREACAGRIPRVEGVREIGVPAPGSYRALILEDGRVLISALDAAGLANWPGLPIIAAENPWHWAYGTE